MLKLEILLFFNLILIIWANDILQDETKKFIPTNEWKKVSPGQHLPAGLHIRHNFETKITEAKLLDPENNQDNKNSIVPVIPIGKENSEVFDEDKERFYQDVNKFRTYDELKKELSSLNLTMKTDMQLINELQDKFKSLYKTTDLETLEYHKRNYTNILYDLEYLMHHIDNGKEFIRIDGIRNVIYPTLILPDNDLKISALKVLSAAVQHNPKVQIHVYELEAIYILMELFRSGSMEMKISSLTALTNLMRRFPVAQWEFINVHKGLDEILTILNKNETLSKNSKLRNKVIILLTDLFDYLRDHPENQEDNASIIKIKLYLNTNFSKDWCYAILNQLIKNIDFVNHDLTTNTFILVNFTNPVCYDVYIKEGLHGRCRFILEHYEKLAEIEMDEQQLNESTDIDNYFLNLKLSVESVVDYCYSLKNKNKIKDEL